MIHTITIILPTNELSDEINGILHNYANIILGRIGLPRVDENEFISMGHLDQNKRHSIVVNSISKNYDIKNNKVLTPVGLLRLPYW